jgi:hypothetical protein
MRKKLAEEYITKAKKRELKKRLRMRIHGRSLLIGSKYAGGKITKR